MGKLVRDLIPEMIAADRRTPDVQFLPAKEIDAALFEKLGEG